MLGIHVYLLPGGRWDCKWSRGQVVCRFIGHKGSFRYNNAGDPWRDCPRCNRRELWLSRWHLTI